MFCTNGIVEHGQSSEQKGSDSSSAIYYFIDYFASEVDQLAKVAFYDLVLLIREVVLTIDC